MKIIIVPFYEAKPAMLKRHQELLRELGYSSDICPLPYHMKAREFIRYRSLQKFWADSIRQYLKGQKEEFILFSFSNPGAASLRAISETHLPLLRGLIFDSGPSGDFFPSIIGLLTHYRKWPTWLAWPMAGVFYVLWGWDWNAGVREAVAKLPPDLPILSIQAGQDLLISPKQIKRAFEPRAAHAKYKEILFETASHLTPIKADPQLYRETLQSFLRSIS